MVIGPGRVIFTGRIGHTLRDPPVPGQNQLAGRDRPGNRRDPGGECAVTRDLFGEVFEIDAVQMPALVEDVVLPANLSVGGDVDAGVDLVPDDLFDRLDESLFSRLAGPGEPLLVAGALPSLEQSFALRTRARILGVGKPVTDRCAARLREGPDRRRQQSAVRHGYAPEFSRPVKLMPFSGARRRISSSSTRRGTGVRLRHSGAAARPHRMSNSQPGMRRPAGADLRVIHSPASMIYGSIDETSSTISSWRAAMSSESPITIDSI